MPTLFAVDAPADIDDSPIRDLLDDGARSGEIGFEEANLRHAA